jgi:4-amino-4-deoxy-L-arabinose transferase-like glycosyltransferase
LIEIWAVTPDMLMAAFVLLAASLLLQIRQGRSSGSTFVLFGLFLGLAYLTKAVMLPIAAVFLVVGAVSAYKTAADSAQHGRILALSHPLYRRHLPDSRSLHLG